jgi:mannosyltransferase OCH1-like enzyme
MYPKIIHQIWLQGEDQVPSKYDSYIQSVKQLHADWEYKLWDDKKISALLDKYPDWKIIYDGFPYLHQKVDYAKYVILWEQGGTYLDIDVIALKALDPLINRLAASQLIVSALRTNFFENCIVCQRAECINNGVIISKPQSVVLLEIIDHINKNNSCSSITPKFFCIMRTTGPSMFTQVIDASPNKDQVVILPAEYFEPCIKTFCEITENTYLKHVHANTWMSDSLQAFHSFYLEYRWWILLGFLICCYCCYYYYNKSSTG